MLLAVLLIVAEPSSEESVFDILGEQEEVVMTSRAPLKVRESGSSVWVIDRQTIEATAATSLGEILRLIPGVIVRELSSSMTDTHFRFPLLVPDNQVLVLIDGRNALTDVFGTSLMRHFCRRAP